jgi:diadenosine tetraphosphate (Ap4A) HIT family hydrolase
LSINNGSGSPISQARMAPAAPPAESSASQQGGGRPSPCVFCDDTWVGDVVARSFTTLAVPDAHPLSPGHTLVVPRRHVQNVFELSSDEYDDVWRLVHRVRDMLLRHHAPAGMTVGCNDGEAAGQTVEHAHVHVIPRYPGDVDDPRGGIRWVIPHHAPYWSTSDRPPNS